MNNSLYGRRRTNPHIFFQTMFLHDEKKITKSVSKPTFKKINRYKNYTKLEYTKKEYDSIIYVGVIMLELSKLHMYDVFYNILQPSLKDIQLHYMNTDSFVLGFISGNISDDNRDFYNFDIPIKTNNPILSQASKIIDEIINLSHKTYSFKHYNAKKRIKKRNEAKHEEHFNALIYNTERTVEECRIQKIGRYIKTTETSKTSLNTFDDKRFYVYNIKSYSHVKTSIYSKEI